MNIESWNEYDEGSGIYRANSGPPFIKPEAGNTATDTWSATNDPLQYIKTTAAGAGFQRYSGILMPKSCCTISRPR